ncbi:hypothetical protein [Nocardia tengchongensis]|uniref:hypothetical protein n=1 Tax=Nocardia tengchongensis TaxID=2055889 RepID=UPI00368390E6
MPLTEVARGRGYTANATAAQRHATAEVLLGNSRMSGLIDAEADGCATNTAGDGWRLLGARAMAARLVAAAPGRGSASDGHLCEGI